MEWRTLVCVCLLAFGSWGSAAEPVVLFFTSVACPHCPPVEQQMDRLLQADGWDIVTLKLEDNREAAEAFGVKAVPSMVLANTGPKNEANTVMVAAGYSDTEMRGLFERFKIRRKLRK